MGSRGFSLIPLDGLSMVISANPHLLLPSKSVLGMPGSRTGLPSLNGMRRREGGIGILVIILQARRRKLK